MLKIKTKYAGGFLRYTSRQRGGANAPLGTGTDSNASHGINQSNSRTNTHIKENKTVVQTHRNASVYQDALDPKRQLQNASMTDNRSVSELQYEVHQ